MAFRVEVVHSQGADDPVRDVYRVEHSDFADFMAKVNTETLVKMAVKIDDAVPWTDRAKAPLHVV